MPLSFLLEKVNSILEKYKLDLDARVILDNHYHFLIRVADGELVAPFVTKRFLNTKQRLERELKFANTGEERIGVLAQFIARWTPIWEKRMEKIGT